MFVFWNSEGILLLRFVFRLYLFSNVYVVFVVIVWKFIYDFLCVLNVINLYKLISCCFRKFVYEFYIYSVVDDK